MRENKNILFLGDYRTHRCRVASRIGHIKLKSPKPLSPLYPKQLSTLGDHIRKERLDRNLSQPQVATIIGVTTDCVVTWELNRYSPQIKYHPKIVTFLGYDPTITNTKNSLRNKVLNYRKEHGLSRKRLAKLWGIDENTIKRIEKGNQIFNKTKEKIEGILM